MVAIIGALVWASVCTLPLVALLFYGIRAERKRLQKLNVLLSFKRQARWRGRR